MTPTEAHERRKERLLALRECTLKERRFLRVLPEHRYAPYTAGKALGLSDRNTWLLLKRPRIKRAMEAFLQDALDEIGVSHASLVADLVEVKDRCMQARPALDKKGNPTGEFQFDAHAAISAINAIADLLKLAPPKRVELKATVENAPGHITPDMDAEEAARVYQDIIRGTLQ